MDKPGGTADGDKAGLDRAVLRAYGMAFLAMLMFTIEATFIKMIGRDINAAQVALVRCVVQFAFLAIWLRGSFRLAFRSDRPRMHIIRGTLSAVGAVAYYYVFANLPLATATVIFFGNVIFTTMAAGPVLAKGGLAPLDRHAGRLCRHLHRRAPRPSRSTCPCWWRSCWP